MTIDVLQMMAQMAEFGQAPPSGCELFSVGYSEVFERLERVYIRERFQRGGSSEKFVIADYGAGKSHFVKQLLALAQQNDCATVEVQLNKQVDFTKQLIVHKEIAENIVVPGQGRPGLESFFRACVSRVRDNAPAAMGSSAEFAASWADQLERQATFEYGRFGKLASKVIHAILREDLPVVEDVTLWLEGEITNRPLAKRLGLTAVATAEHGLVAQKLSYSLFQMVRASGFAGTVVGFDEAEQSIGGADEKTFRNILSILRSGIDSVTRLDSANAFVLFAFTPDVAARLGDYSALAQRLRSDKSFWDGNTLAARIDLQRTQDAEGELVAIAERLVALLYEHAEKTLPLGREEATAIVREMAREVADQNPSMSSRRTLVKNVCTFLIGMHDEGITKPGPIVDVRQDSPEV